MGVTIAEYKRSFKSFKLKFKAAYNFCVCFFINFYIIYKYIQAAQLQNKYWIWVSIVGPCASYGDNTQKMTNSLDDYINYMGMDHLTIMDNVSYITYIHIYFF